MMDETLKKVAEAWIKLNLAERNSQEYEDLFWAYNQLSSFCDDEPEKCFETIRIIRSLNDSDVILSNLAAGPLEDMLVKHGELFIDRIEALAKNDPVYKKLLGAVWQNTISDNIWKRIQAIAGPSW